MTTTWYNVLNSGSREVLNTDGPLTKLDAENLKRQIEAESSVECSIQELIPTTTHVCIPIAEIAKRYAEVMSCKLLGLSDHYAQFRFETEDQVRSLTAEQMMKTFEKVHRPFADQDSNTTCGNCGECLDGKQVVSVPAEFPDDVFCDLQCARENSVPVPLPDERND